MYIATCLILAAVLYLYIILMKRIRAANQEKLRSAEALANHINRKRNEKTYH